MTKAEQFIPWTFRAALSLQLTQALMLLAMSAFGLALRGPDHGATRRQALLNTIVFLLLPGLTGLCAGVLLLIQSRIGWWLAVGWNLIAFSGTVAASLPYLREGISFVLLLPTSVLGFLLARSTRRYFALLSPIEAAPH